MFHWAVDAFVDVFGNILVADEPEIEVELSFVSIAEGYNTELTCTVHGEPRPQVTWSKNGRQIDADARYSHTNSASRHVLAIDNVKTEDFGLYTCSAENRFGSDSKTIEVSGVASAATLKRKKPLANGVELEWVTVSHTAVLEYRIRYRVQSVSAAFHVATGRMPEVHQLPQSNE